MNVLFLMIAYPDVSHNTNMYTDLTSEFLKHGHKVYVAAPDKKSTKTNLEDGITVLRIRTLPLFNTSLVKKGIANILLPFQYKIAIKKYFNNISFDLIITPTPPITFISIITFLKRKHKSKTYLILRDIFPQNAKDLGLIKNNLLFRFFRWKEKKMYRTVDSIGCMSQMNIQYVLNNNPEIQADKIHLLPNWTKQIVIPHDKSQFKKELKIDGKFVAVFAGNFGVPQKVEFLIDVAEELKEVENIVFLLIGEGTEKEKIKKVVAKKKLTNIKILNQLPRLEYLKLLKECDVGIVTLSDKFTIPNIPSRTLSYWLLKLPVLAAIDRNTDFGQILDSYEAGLWSITGNVSDFVKNLYRLYNNPIDRRQMGENGFNLVLNNLNPEKTYKIIQEKVADQNIS